MQKPQRELYTVGVEVLIDLESVLIPGAPSNLDIVQTIDTELVRSFGEFLSGLHSVSEHVKITDVLSKRPDSELHRALLSKIISDAELGNYWPRSESFQLSESDETNWRLDETSNSKRIIDKARTRIVGVIDPNIVELGSQVLSLAVAHKEPLEPIIFGLFDNAQTEDMLKSLEYFAKNHFDLQDGSSNNKTHDFEVEASRNGLSFISTNGASFIINVVRLGVPSEDSGKQFAAELEEYYF